MKRKLIERKCIDCGIINVVRADGAGKRCRTCRVKENSKNKTPKNMINKSFDFLKVLSLSHIYKCAYWNCICNCGNNCVINGNRLRSGKTKSCGCITKTQKGLSNFSTYCSWNSMMQRCNDKSLPHYKRYGGRGISVCERWNEFMNFYNDMGERPLGKTLDRINTLGNYEPSNCRWITSKQQANNKRNNFQITFLGKTKTLTEWSEEYKINWSTLRKRIVGLNWTIEKALLTPVGKYASS